MDNVCHTLLGGALAQAGLKRRTALGTVTLVLAANLPDIDVLAIPLGAGRDFRRGWTHGVLALAVWPLVLTGCMLLIARWRRSAPPPRPGWLLVLAAIGVWSHPLLDFLNNYGLRWLMPFADRWYYGDSLFIVDPWLLLLLGGGIWAARRAERRGRADWFRPARVALALSAIYVGGMIGITVLGRRAVAAAEPAGRSGTGRFMVTPVPIDPFRRQVIADRGDHYAVGTYRLLRRPAVRWTGRVDKGPIHDPAVARAAATEPGRKFLHWSRLPVARMTSGPTDAMVQFYDLRYSDGGAGGWASVEISEPGRPSGSR